MKYYVQVNRHLMTSVEAETALSAEHVTLDMDGIQYSNAFDAEGRKTDTFRGALLDCQTISLNELQRLSEAYTQAWQAVGAAQEQMHIMQREAERIEEMLRKAQNDVTEAAQLYTACLKEARKAKANLYLEDE